MAFHENLLRARRAKGLNQQELAERLGLSRQAVSKWETGDSLPDLYKLAALAEVLDVSMDALCDRETPERAVPSEPPVLPERKKHRVLIVALALAAALVIGFFAGTRAPRQTVESVTMPDTVTVTAVQFANFSGSLYYSFVPSVTGTGYTYQISFNGPDAEPVVLDAACVGGVCSGYAGLSRGIGYTVSAVIHCGTQERVVCLATDLSVDGQSSASWQPVE